MPGRRSNAAKGSPEQKDSDKAGERRRQCAPGERGGTRRAGAEGRAPRTRRVRSAWFGGMHVGGYAWAGGRGFHGTGSTLEGSETAARGAAAMLRRLRPPPRRSSAARPTLLLLLSACIVLMVRWSVGSGLLDGGWRSRGRVGGADCEGVTNGAAADVVAMMCPAWRPPPGGALPVSSLGAGCPNPYLNR